MEKLKLVSQGFRTVKTLLILGSLSKERGFDL